MKSNHLVRLALTGCLLLHAAGCGGDDGNGDGDRVTGSDAAASASASEPPANNPPLPGDEAEAAAPDTSATSEGSATGADAGTSIGMPDASQGTASTAMPDAAMPAPVAPPAQSAPDAAPAAADSAPATPGTDASQQDAGAITTGVREAGAGAADAGADGADAQAGMAAPAGACNNAADLAALSDPQTDVAGEVQSCAVSCALRGNACSGPCVSDALGISTECGGCFGASIACTISNCVLACLDPSSSSCALCQASNCIPSFVECAGVVPPGE